MNIRINKVRELLSKKNLDAILITSKANKQYIGALTGSGVKVLLTANANYQIMDGRYINEAEKMSNHFQNIVYDQGSNYMNEVLNICGSNCKLGIEGSKVTATEYLQLKKQGFYVELLANELEYIRRLKDKNEIALIKEACQITDDIFELALSKIHVGMTESELAAIITYFALSKGASAMAFDMIIASGIRSALPHGRPTSKTFQNHEFITIDFGIIYNGYQSDMTRTICLGEPTDQMREIYNVVKDAQQAGIAFIKNGVRGKDVDKYVRDIISQAGYGDYFTHGLGHGIGIGGGEYPLLNKQSDMILENGMIMSCEPGIYLPNLGGVRIEDDVLISNDQGIELNKTSKELIIIEAK